MIFIRNITVQTDGSRKTINGQRVGVYGFVVTGSDGKDIYSENGKIPEVKSSDQAELAGLINCSLYLKKNWDDEGRTITVKTDPKYVHRKIEKANISSLFDADMEFKRVPRTEVARADSLCRDRWQGIYVNNRNREIKLNIWHLAERLLIMGLPSMEEENNDV